MKQALPAFDRRFDADSKRWIEGILPFYTFLNVFQHYIDLDCFAVPMEDVDWWMSINRCRRLLGSLDLQHLHASPHLRSAYNRKAFERVKKSLKPYKGTLAGFCDLFVPVVSKGKCIAVLVAGPFADHGFHAADIRNIWPDAAGGVDAAFGNDLLYFGKVLLETPVLEGSAYISFERLMILFAGVLSGETNPRVASEEMQSLLEKNFSKHFFHFDWSQRAIRQDRHFQAQWVGGSVSEWESREIGIHRVPDRILATMAVDAEGTVDPLEFMAQSIGLQRWAHRQALKHPEVASGPLENYGVLFLLSKSPEQNEIQAALAARDFAIALQLQARKDLGLKLAFGIGTREPKERLYDSYRRALQALNVGASLGRDITQFEPSMLADLGITGSRSLVRLERELLEALLGGKNSAVMPARDRLIQAAILQSHERTDSLRVHFLHVLGALIEESESRYLLEAKNASEIMARCEAYLARPGHSADLVRSFQSRIEEIAGALNRPVNVDRDLRAHRALRYVEQNFHRSLKMDEVARLHGFSPSAFSRDFKSRSGKTFSQMLSDLRLNYSRDLLQGTRLPASQVSVAAGFHSLSYFFQWFKSQTGNSPKEYRRKARFSAVEPK